MKITAYKLVQQGHGLDEFTEDVNNLIQLGWLPLGGPFCGNMGRLIQPMVAVDDKIEAKWPFETYGA